MPSPPAPPLDDYEAIALAVAETERGRWFLDEYARRNRAADTAAVLEALSGLEARLATEKPAAAAAPAGVETARALVEAASKTAARLREGLEASHYGERALARCVALEEALAAAVTALGGAPRPVIQRIQAPSPITAAFGSVTEPAPDFDWVEAAPEDAEETDARAFGEDAADAADSGPSEPQDAAAEEPDLPHGPAADVRAVVFVDDAPGSAEPLEIVETQSVQPVAAGRARSKTADGWTPGLLDRLTPEERSILFA